MAPRNTKRAAKPKPGTLKRNVSFGEDRNGSTRISRPGMSPTTPPGRRYPLTSPPLTRTGAATPKRSMDSSPQPPPPPKKFGLFNDPDNPLQRTAQDAFDWVRSDYYWRPHPEDPINDQTPTKKTQPSGPIMQGLGWEWETPFEYGTPKRNKSRSPRVPRTPTKPNPYGSPEAYYGLPALPYFTGPTRPAFSDDGNLFGEETTAFGPELDSAEWVKIRRLQNGLIVLENEGVWQKLADGETTQLEGERFQDRQVTTHFSDRLTPQAGATSFSRKRASDTQYIPDTVWENHQITVLSNGNVVPQSPAGFEKIVHDSVRDDNGYILYAGLNGVEDDNKRKSPNDWKAKVSAQGNPLWENKEMAVYRNGTLRFKSYGFFVEMCDLIPQLIQSGPPTPSPTQSKKYVSSRQSPVTPTPAARVFKESSARANKNRKSREKKGLAKLNAGRREKLPHVAKADFEVKRATRSTAKEQDEKFYALP
ncbi:hypothetical protein CBER1_07684 [Cercospora berteroae]|uniref:Uncharacterized protein n=1 Tax=Cercospora berteroae TaxID=357750 RepID=A0A2S6BT82_9PEZI|nr:hypothetical protein CBER1_07684 [Cercospora berteroae]